LLGKTIQNLANFTYFSEKDSYMVPVNEMITENIDKMKEYYSTVSKAPSSWKETPQRTEVWLEMELASLHEMVRTHHSKLDPSSEICEKILQACHVVVKPADEEESSHIEDSLLRTPSSEPLEPHEHSPKEEQQPSGLDGIDKESEEIPDVKMVQDHISKLNVMREELQRATETWEFEEAAHLRDGIMVGHSLLLGMVKRLQQNKNRSQGLVGEKEKQCLEMVENFNLSFAQNRPTLGRFSGE
jgi:hypothetical protein